LPITLLISHLVIAVWVISFGAISTPLMAQENSVLRLAMTLEPPVLDPTINASTSIQKITYQNIFEGLTQINNLNQVQPSLAKAWEIDDTGLIYTFHIRKRVFFRLCSC
jgi:peptide/nickel transport system substrate-binding protein